MKNIQVISSDIDGADLRRKKAKNKYYFACKGSHDDNQINEAIQFVGTNQQFSIPSEAYERIFG